MYKIYDYYCYTCQILQEKMVGEDEEITCQCGAKMHQEIPAPYGRVNNTNTPVNQLKR